MEKDVLVLAVGKLVIKGRERERGIRSRGSADSEQTLQC